MTTCSSRYVAPWSSTNGVTPNISEHGIDMRRSYLRIFAAARQHSMYVVAGSSYLPDEVTQRIVNASYLFGPSGETIGYQNKIHLYIEDTHLCTPGNEIKVFSTDFGKVGITICYESMFPEVGRFMAFQGAQALVNVSACPGERCFWKIRAGALGLGTTSVQRGVLLLNAIEVKNLTKYYGKVRGIENLSFEVKEGEIFGFIGPNGAGKTTTIRTLLGLVFPTSGSATIFGRDCIKHGTQIRKYVGYLPSEVFYYDQMKVIDLLLYSASFFKKDCTERIHELAEAMELSLERKIEDLSYGNKKKVGIVQGLLHDPKLLLLDEPTSGLDPLMQKRFFDIVARENKKGVTVFSPRTFCQKCSSYATVSRS